MEYYHSGKKSYRDYEFSCEQTGMSFRNIQEKINENKQFCKEESSIKRNELMTYVADGISFFIQEEEEIKGLVNFTVNVDKITIKGICVPGESKGTGKKLIEAVKSFALANNITQIKLTCYGDVFNFYLKQGFNIEESNEIYDSDEDELVATSYVMTYNISSRGRKRRTKHKSKRINKSKKSPK